MRFIEKIAREFAPGIPSKKKVTNPRRITKPEVWLDSIIQTHDARRAGKHFDLRIGDPKTKIGHSWALRKLPGPGEKALAIQQPDHTLAYFKFTGTIGPGYGAGEVRRHSLLETEVLEASKDKIIFNRYQGRDTHEYILRRMKGKNWLLINRTPTIKSHPMPESKPKYREIKPEQVDPSKPGRWDAKIDGAHCFTFDTYIKTLEYGRMRISVLVNQDLESHVRSAPASGGDVEWKRVTRKYRSAAPRELLRISVASEKTRRIKCTLGHEIVTDKGKVQARNLAVGEMVATEQIAPSKTLQNAIVGMMLGDSSSHVAGRSNWPRISFTHGPSQEIYIRHKRDLLDSFCRQKIREEDSKNSFGKKKLRFSTRSLPCFKSIRDLFYPDGEKRITKEILDLLTPVSLAYWYMDDGHASVAGNKYGDDRQLFVSLHTEGFREEDTDLAVSWFNDKYGIKARKCYDQERRPYIGMGAAAGMRFLSIVSPHILECFRYKMGTDYYKYDHSIMDAFGTEILVKDPHVSKIIYCPIVKVEPYNSPDSSQYDHVYNLEVEGNHTFVVSTVLVGNSNYVIDDGKPIRAFSYRPSVRGEALIQHTFRIPQLRGKKSPRKLKRTILRGEVWAAKPDGKAIASSELGGLLNSAVLKSRKAQKTKGSLRNAIFDIVQYKGKDVQDLGTEEKRRLIDEIIKRPDLKGIFHKPRSATSESAKKKLFEKIQRGELKQTKEGIIIHSPGGTMTKVKFKPEWDVRISAIFSKAKTRAKGQAGGFTYDRVDGSPVNRRPRVGTGFSHKLRRAMAEHPEDFVGLIAKVEGLEQHPSGAIRAPSFKEWHLDKNDPRLIPEIKK